VHLRAGAAYALQRHGKDHLAKAWAIAFSRTGGIEGIENPQLISHCDQSPNVPYATVSCCRGLRWREHDIILHRAEADLLTHRMLLAADATTCRENPVPSPLDFPLENVHFIQLHLLGELVKQLRSKWELKLEVLG